jgi:hypothetical protein
MSGSIKNVGAGLSQPNTLWTPWNAAMDAFARAYAPVAEALATAYGCNLYTPSESSEDLSQKPQDDLSRPDSSQA